MIQLATLPNGKRVLFIGDRCWQQWPGHPWEPLNSRILLHTPIPWDATVETVTLRRAAMDKSKAR